MFTPLPYPEDLYGNYGPRPRPGIDIPSLSVPQDNAFGWFDPRVYGGRMLDVSSGSADMFHKYLNIDINCTVPVYRLPRGTHECDHIKPFRPPYLNRRRPAGVSF